MHPESARQFALSLAALSALSGAAVVEQTYHFTVNPQLSVVDTSLAFVTSLAGDFIGDFDAETNPGGTITLPGLFGGGANTPIGYEADLQLNAGTITAPTGTFDLVVDEDALTVAVENFAGDLLGGAPLAADAVLSIVYETFHTQNPTAVFPGGFPVEVPFPGVAEVTSVTATQTGPAAGFLFKLGGHIYSLGLGVPVDVVIEATVLGEPTGPMKPFPVILPITGTLDLDSTPTLVVESGIALAEEAPLGLPFEGVPVPVPTILPPGGVANVLFGGDLSDVAVDLSIDVTIAAIGMASCADADLDCDGDIDGGDVGVLLGAWGTPGPGDFDANGVVDDADLGILLAVWGDQM